MKFSVKGESSQHIVDSIIESIGGRELGKMLTLESLDGFLSITISKMGTSKLTFKEIQKEGEVEYHLESEKIAFAHKAFKDQVKQKLCSVVEKVGGKVISA